MDDIYFEDFRLSVALGGIFQIKGGVKNRSRTNIRENTPTRSQRQLECGARTVR